MKINRFLPLALCALSLRAAHAQPDPNVVPKDRNPPNRPVRGGGQNLTPEQQRARIADGIRRNLVAANVTDQKQQDAVVFYVTSELEARQKLGELAKTLATGIRNNTLSDAQVAGLLNDYVAAVQDDHTRHQKALDTLKTAINVSQFPRLEAGLTLFGLYNDAPFFGTGGFGGNNRNNRRNGNNAAKPNAGGNANAGNNGNTRPAPF